MTRYFTVDEANALLPTLRPHAATLVRAWKRLSARQADVVAILDRAPRNDLGGPLLAAAAADIVLAQNALFAIQTLGVELKDPATCLVDFRALRDGVEVYLCWRYGEPRVAFWHPLEAGFAGRQPIDEE
ncbi:MAG: hypothetical protein RLZZ387_112 [Chloroflexota bacterium]|jgi:hypothetical protein